MPPRRDAIDPNPTCAIGVNTVASIDRQQSGEHEHSPNSARRADGAERPRRFVFVDALRGVAALWVVLFHTFAGSHMSHLEPRLPTWMAQLIHVGYLGVSVFFVLSGFVIAHSIGRHRVTASYFRWFVLRRSVRLDLPYWVAIAVTIWVGAQSSTPTPAGVLAHMFYLQDLLRYKPLSLVYWTLSLEFQLYLIFALLLGLAQRFRSSDTDRRSLFIIFTAVALVATLWPAALVPQEAPLPGLFLRLWYAFLLGAFAWWAVDRTIGRSAFYLYAGGLLAGAVNIHNTDAMVSIAIAAVLLEVGRAGKLRDWLNWRPLQFLGRISYSLYLLHGPISVVTLGYTLYRLTPRTAAWELFWLVGLLAANCSGAWLFWRVVEKPCVTLSQYCRPPRE